MCTYREYGGMANILVYVILQACRPIPLYRTEKGRLTYTIRSNIYKCLTLYNLSKEYGYVSPSHLIAPSYYLHKCPDLSCSCPVYVEHCLKWDCQPSVRSPNVVFVITAHVSAQS